MKRSVVISAVLVCLMLGMASVRAEEKAPKIGVVRIQQVFKDYQYARDMEKKIKDAFQKDENEIKALRNKIKQAEERLRNDPMVEPRSLKWKLLMLDIQRDKAMMEEQMDKFKKNTRKAMAQFYRTIYADFRTAIDQFCKRNGYDLVITAPDRDLSDDKDADDSPVAIQNEIMLRSVQFISPTTDVTDKIISEMNTVYAKRKQR